MHSSILEMLKMDLDKQCLHTSYNLYTEELKETYTIYLIEYQIILSLLSLTLAYEHFWFFAILNH